MQSIGSSGPPLLVGDPLSPLLVIGSVPPLIDIVLVDIVSELVVDIVVLVAVTTSVSEVPPLAGSSSTSQPSTTQNANTFFANRSITGSDCTYSEEFREKCTLEPHHVGLSNRSYVPPHVDRSVPVIGRV